MKVLRAYLFLGLQKFQIQGQVQNFGVFSSTKSLKGLKTLAMQARCQWHRVCRVLPLYQWEEVF